MKFVGNGENFLMRRVCTFHRVEHDSTWHYMAKRERERERERERGEAIPVQASTGPEGSSRLKLPDLKTIGT
jgi:hypothetical protein